MIANFKEHKGPVTSVQFHPKEFLLATGSSDRTAMLWDLERFEVIFQTAPEANGIRSVTESFNELYYSVFLVVVAYLGIGIWYTHVDC